MRNGINNDFNHAFLLKAPVLILPRVVLSSSPALSIQLNDGGGGFGPVTPLPPGFGLEPYFLLPLDLDGDGAIDIVDSTRLLAEWGDRRWRELLEQFYGTMREGLEQFRGREIDTTGDGLFASFDGPARAIRCACRTRDAIASLGIAIRAGLHTGECEVLGDKMSGIAVHLGARVAGQAEPGEVLVSSTVKDLVAGSGLSFRDRGLHDLKGIPGQWRLFAANA